ncbi:MarR family winged helix-turn-helix transcriptional regulator [Oceanicella sp. SM1341]|uniref:MarR family winged helix-turn-helix transcriptional regulator n=1 Tax=Oceanicella sp. SM1341 TaxID=1548889 RepID=UPI000E4CF8B3|nr:MarR family transcriptional regulator [Oceanicella sp. SM1341]
MIEDIDGRTETLGEIGLNHFAPYLMNRIMGRYNDTLRGGLKANGLTTAQMRALATLVSIGPVTINELSVLSVFEQSTMSRTLDAMEAAGFVRREASETDSRVRLIHVTDEGRRTFENAWPAMHAVYSAMFDGVGADERAAFVATLQKILRNIRQHEI